MSKEQILKPMIQIFVARCFWNPFTVISSLRILLFSWNV